MAGSVTFGLDTAVNVEQEYVVALHGDIDLYCAPELKSEFARLIAQGATRIVVDLSEATFIDSTTLGVLLGTVKRLRPVEGEVAIVCTDRNIRKIFEITLLDRVFPLFESREAAVDAGPRSAAR